VQACRNSGNRNVEEDPLSATEQECDPLTFAREHDLAGHLDRETIANTIANKTAAEATAELLALGFQEGWKARQREDAKGG
jgi:hypothetical protein